VFDEYCPGLLTKAKIHAGTNRAEERGKTINGSVRCCAAERQTVSPSVQRVLKNEQRSIAICLHIEMLSGEYLHMGAKIHVGLTQV
jgi:hypothetical protein